MVPSIGSLHIYKGAVFKIDLTVDLLNCTMYNIYKVGEREEVRTMKRILTDKEKAEKYDKTAKTNERVRVRRQLTITKAKAAGIKVTDAEVDAYIKKSG